MASTSLPKIEYSNDIEKTPVSTCSADDRRTPDASEKRWKTAAVVLKMVNRWYLYSCVQILMLYLLFHNSDPGERLHWTHDMMKATVVATALLTHPSRMDLMDREDFRTEGLELKKRMVRHWGGMMGITLCVHGGVFLWLQYWKW